MIARLAPAALRRRILAGGAFALLDVRERRPFAGGHILTASSAPLSRLPAAAARLLPCRRVAVALADAGDGLAHKAGRALAALGYGDLAVLEGGVPAWRRAGYRLFQGFNVPSKAFGEVVEQACATPSLAPAEVRRRLAARCGVEVLDAEGLAAWRRQAGRRTLHIFDVRQGEEYAAASLADAAAVEGTQLVQTADDHIAVRDARILLLDDDGVRARVTAAWLKQMGYRRTAVLAEDVRRLGGPRPLPPQQGGDADALAPFDEAGDEDAAGRAYIAWELQLPQQLARDSLLTFRPLA